MNLVALQISAIAVLSPILFAVGALHLFSASSLGGPAVALNLLTATIGGLSFGLDLPFSYSRLLTVCLVFFAALTLVADGRLCHRLWKVLSSPPARVKTPMRAKAPVWTGVPKPPQPVAPMRSRPTTLFPAHPFARTASRPEEVKRVEILSPSAWVLHNDWGDIRVYTVPPAIIERKKGLADSDRQFRIMYDEEAEPIEDTFRISSNFQILLPPECGDKLKGSERIHFEILDTPAYSFALTPSIASRTI